MTGKERLGIIIDSELSGFDGGDSGRLDNPMLG